MNNRRYDIYKEVLLFIENVITQREIYSSNLETTNNWFWKSFDKRNL